MASNNPWPSVTASSSSNKGHSRGKNNTNKKKDHQQMVLDLVTEMFSTTLEQEVILSLAQNCNWELQSTIEALIALSATVEISTNKTAENMKIASSMLQHERDNNIHMVKDQLSYEYLKMDQIELKQQLEGLNKFEELKKNSTKNRMDFFKENIAKLDEPFSETQMNIEKKSSWNSINYPNERNNMKVWENKDDTFSSNILSQSDQIKSKKLSNISQPSTYNANQTTIATSLSTTATSTSPINVMAMNSLYENQTSETSSKHHINSNKYTTTGARQLCGLQVHYRSPGMETSSDDDDDADVVIEEEFNAYTIPSAETAVINVSQFTSSTVEISPLSIPSHKTAQILTTASPLSNNDSTPPYKNVYKATLDKIEKGIHSGDKILILLRGLPGSGKSTLAKSLAAIAGTSHNRKNGNDRSPYIFSTDDYFQQNKRGIYIFDQMKLNDAHNTNQRRVYDALKSTISPVIVDNTNLQIWEMRPYASMAVQQGYYIEILDMDTPWANNINELTKKNCHNVPKNRIVTMKSRYEHRGISGQELMELYSLKYPTSFKTTKISEKFKDNEDVLTPGNMMKNLQNTNEILPNTYNNDTDEIFSKINSNNKELGKNKSLNYPRKSTRNYEKNEIKNREDRVIMNITGESKKSDQNTQKVKINTVHGEEKGNYLLLQQPLGAIGSERKNNLVQLEIIIPPKKINLDLNNKNKGLDLSQCRDFTILLNGQIFHSDHHHLHRDDDDRCLFNNLRELPTMKSNQAEEQNNEFENKGQQNDVCTATTTIHPLLLTTSLAEHLLLRVENDSNSNTDKDHVDGFESKNSKVITREVTEYILDSSEAETVELGKVFKHTRSHYRDNVSQISNLICITDSEHSYKYVPIEYLEFKVKELKNERTNAKLKIFFVDDIDGKLKFKSIGIKVDSNSNDTENKIEKVVNNDVIINEENYESSTKSTLSTFLSMLRTSILGANIVVLEQWPEINTKKLYIVNNNIQLSKTEEKCEEKLDDNKYSNEIKYEDVSNYLNAHVDIKSIGREMEQADYHVKTIHESMLNNNMSIQQQYKRLKKSNDGKHATISELLNLSSSTEDKQQSVEKSGNIDQITWKEPPFPLDDVSPVVQLISKLNIPKNISKVDAFTNTTYHDFNIALKGEASEPGYRVINAFSPRIYEEQLPHVINVKQLSSKLMFDKSSMTDELFDREGDPDLKDNDENFNRISELIELFPHIPREYLTEIYEKCMKNFGWTVEVLLDGVPTSNEVTIEVPENMEMIDRNFLKPLFNDVSSDQSTKCSLDRAEKTNDHLYIIETEKTSNIGSMSNLNHQQYQYQYDNQVYEVKIDEECLIEYKQAKIGISDEDISSLNFEELNSMKQELSENEKGTRDPEEETIELNLGCEFVRLLENQFGNPDFHIPDGFQPIITVKKSLAEELYTLWIESLYQQLNLRHEQLDRMISKDAEFAKSLEREMKHEAETRKFSKSDQCESAIPTSLNEIMDMELALATYKNELKSISDDKIPDDMASRLSRRMLYESLPDMDPEMFNEILKAHNGNFKETFSIIESNTGRSITPFSDGVLSKTSTHDSNRFGEPMKKEKSNNLNNGMVAKLKSNTSIMIARSDSKICKDDKSSSYESALTKITNSRQEAQRQFSLRIYNFNKATEAYRRGHPQVAAYYSQIARLHSENIEAAHADIASTSVKAQIFGDNDNTLDLHYLFVTEALQALDEFLDYHLNKLSKGVRKRSSVLYIITGRGARSNNGTSKIKPAVSKRLVTRNIRFSEVNPGCLKINLYRKNEMLD